MSYENAKSIKRKEEFPDFPDDRSHKFGSGVNEFRDNSSRRIDRVYCVRVLQNNERIIVEIRS